MQIGGFHRMGGLVIPYGVLAWGALITPGMCEVVGVMGPVGHVIQGGSVRIMIWGTVSSYGLQGGGIGHPIRGFGLGGVYHSGNV